MLCEDAIKPCETGTVHVPDRVCYKCDGGLNAGYQHRFEGEESDVVSRKEELCHISSPFPRQVVRRSQTSVERPNWEDVPVLDQSIGGRMAKVKPGMARFEEYAVSGINTHTDYSNGSTDSEPSTPQQSSEEKSQVHGAIYDQGTRKYTKRGAIRKESETRPFSRHPYLRSSQRSGLLQRRRLRFTERSREKLEETYPDHTAEISHIRLDCEPSPS